MRAMVSVQQRLLFPGEAEWINYALGCIDSGFCPICGNDLLTLENTDEVQHPDSDCCYCPVCDWHELV